MILIGGLGSSGYDRYVFAGFTRTNVISELVCLSEISYTCFASLVLGLYCRLLIVSALGTQRGLRSMLVSKIETSALEVVIYTKDSIHQ